ncbi:MAG: hypothetical protein JSR86_07510 [Proteobacteria bacterium]|nr:hypothetical protein [Pseudomonadota bacterium]
MSRKFAVVAVAAASLMGGQALAQSAALPTLSGLQGAVYVDQGDGFVRADGRTVLHRGDRVMSARGGLAKISYADGCNVQVGGRSLATINSQSPCAGGGSPRVLKADYQSDAGGAGGGGGGFAGVSTTGLIIGGVAAAGIIAVIVGAATDHGSSHTSGGTSGGGGGPVSP